MIVSFEIEKRYIQTHHVHQNCSCIGEIKIFQSPLTLVKVAKRFEFKLCNIPSTFKFLISVNGCLSYADNYLVQVVINSSFAGFFISQSIVNNVQFCPRSLLTSRRNISP